ncbi:5-bromo-4-chloroindolyl phosphate hydrolysis family protein [Periweissella cryptocerci]|uniref:5-bromo-4-chloroindolyl phosphate hydrolysis family protein n=1 Tax=Periweissella cryptocerci TaxID=2506420 RepID=UPI0014052D42|nr:5-bromo-4-chloroindolyl phosphate hydrolysis family protein [Periweissella cryptocerci]
MWIFFKPRFFFIYVLPFFIYGTFAGLSTLTAGVGFIVFILYYVVVLNNRKKIRKVWQQTFQASPRMKLTKNKNLTGFSRQDIAFFNKTMRTAETQLHAWEDSIHANNRLLAIDTKTQGFKAATGLYNELQKEPRKLAYADQFLYTHLPNVVDLSGSFVEISNHTIKNEAVYDSIKAAATTIEAVSMQIADDYTKFVADDLDDIDLQMSIAQQNIEFTNYIKEKRANDQ